MNLRITALGQTGYLFELDDCRFLIDPYLSEYVAIKYGDHLKRRKPSSFAPEEMTAIDLVLITHAHEDHCDPITLKGVLSANPDCKIFGSFDCLDVLKEAALPVLNFRIADQDAIVPPRLPNVRITAIPSAHTEMAFNASGHSQFLGYVIQIGSFCLYHAGDTIPHEEITQRLKSFGKIDVAMLPVNERNHFRDREGIIGNMSPKEALQWAKEMGAETVIPTHWDTFAPNSTHQAEVELIHELDQHSFKLQWLSIDETLDIQIEHS